MRLAPLNRSSSWNRKGKVNLWFLPATAGGAEEHFLAGVKQTTTSQEGEQEKKTRPSCVRGPSGEEGTENTSQLVYT